MKWFTLILSALCLIVPTVAAAQTGDKYLQHVYVALYTTLRHRSRSIGFK